MTDIPLQLEKTWYYRPDKTMDAYLNKRPGKDAGYDVYAARDMWFLPFQTRVVYSNSHFHIPENNFGRITSRSGHSGKGWLTHAGTIDRGYTGNVKIVQTNLSLLPRKIKKGERVAQIIFMPFTAVEMDEIHNLEEFENLVRTLTLSDRGKNGFNSSGKY